MGVNLLLDALIECLPQAGHANDDAHLAAAERVHDVGARHGGADGHTRTYQDGSYHGAQQGQHVMQGQQYHGAAVGCKDGHVLAHGTDVGIEVGKAQHHALGIAGGARCVDDEGRFLIGTPDAGLLSLRCGQFIVVNQTDGQAGSAYPHGLFHHGKQFGRGPYARRIAVIQDIGHIVRCGAGIYRYGNAALCPDGEKRINPSLPVLGEKEGAGVLSLWGEACK